MELKEALIKLKAKRAEHGRAKDVLRIVQDEFERNHKNLIEAVQAVSNELSEAEGEVRKIAVDEYDKTEQKKLYGGVGIRVTYKPTYEPKTAFEWALDHKLFLLLDKKGFEKMCKTTPPEFVSFDEIVTATLPKEIKIE